MIQPWLYRAYHRSHSLGQWIRHHISPAGALAGAAVCLPGIAGLMLFRTQLYQITALGLVLALIALISGIRPFRPTIRIRRILPGTLTVQEPGRYEIELTNLSGKIEKGLILFEQTQDPRPDFHTLVSSPEPLEETRNAWDRNVLIFRWKWLVKKEQKADFAPVFLPDLPPDKPVRVVVKVTPSFRGPIRFTAVLLARPDILGFFHRLHRTACPQALLVLPRQYRVAPPGSMTARKIQPGGIHQASFLGDSTEFASLRPHRPGDGLKHVHWKTAARTGELVVREFEDEFFVRQALVLDTDLGQQNPVLFEAAVSIAASYLSSVPTREAILDLIFSREKLFDFPSGRSLLSHSVLLKTLACVQPSTEPAIRELSQHLAMTGNRFSGAICIFLSWTGHHRAILEHFRRHQVPVLAILVTDHPRRDQRKTRAACDDHIRIKVVAPDRIVQRLGQP